MIRRTSIRNSKEGDTIYIKPLTSLQINQLQQFLSSYRRLDQKKQQQLKMEDFIAESVLATITTLYCADCEFDELTEHQKIQRLDFVLRAQKKYAKQFLTDRLKNMKFVLLEGRTYYESCLAHILEGCRLSELFNDGEVVHDILKQTRLTLPPRLGLRDREDITLFGQLAFLLEVNRHRCPNLSTVKEDKAVLELEVEELMSQLKFARSELRKLKQSTHHREENNLVQF